MSSDGDDDHRQKDQDEASESDRSSQWGLGDDEEEEDGAWLDAALVESKAALLQSQVARSADPALDRLRFDSETALHRAQALVDGSLEGVVAVIPDDGGDGDAARPAPSTNYYDPPTAKALERRGVDADVRRAVDALVDAVCALHDASSPPPMMTMGSSGVISVAATPVENAAARVIQHVLRGDFRANRLDFRVAERRFAQVRDFSVREAPGTKGVAEKEVEKKRGTEEEEEAAAVVALLAAADADAFRAEVEAERRRREGAARAQADRNRGLEIELDAMHRKLFEEEDEEEKPWPVEGRGEAAAVSSSTPALLPHAWVTKAGGAPKTSRAPRVSSTARLAQAFSGLRVARWVEGRVTKKKRRVAEAERAETERLQMERAELEGRRWALRFLQVLEREGREREAMVAEEAAARRVAEGRVRMTAARRAAAHRFLVATARTKVGEAVAADRAECADGAVRAARTAAAEGASAVRDMRRAVAAAKKAARAFLDAETARDRAVAAGAVESARDGERARAAIQRCLDAANQRTREAETRLALAAARRDREAEDRRRDRQQSDAAARADRHARGALAPWDQRVAAVDGRSSDLAIALFAASPNEDDDDAEEREAPASMMSEATARRVASESWRLATYWAQPQPQPPKKKNKEKKKAASLSFGGGKEKDEKKETRAGVVAQEKDGTRRKAAAKALSLEMVSEAAEGGAVEEVRWLELSVERLGGDLSLLGACRRLVALNLSVNALDTASLASLGAVQIPGIRWLALAENRLGDEAVEALAWAGGLTTVEWLDLDSNGLTSLGMVLDAAPALRTLKCANNRLGGGGGLLLGEEEEDAYDHPPHKTQRPLEKLLAPGNCLGPTLVLPRGLDHLVDVDVSRNQITALDGAALSLGAPNLRRLVASHNVLNEPPNPLALRSLDTLWLNGNAIQSIEAFWAGQETWLPALHELHVAHNRLTHLMPLGPIAPRLGVLDASHNALGDVWDLARAVPPRLRSLAIRGNPAVDGSLLDASLAAPRVMARRLRAAVTAWLAPRARDGADLIVYSNNADTAAEVASALMVAALSAAYGTLEALNGDRLADHFPKKDYQRLLRQLRFGLFSFFPSDDDDEPMVDVDGTESRLAAFAGLFPRSCDGCGARLAVPRALLKTVRGEDDDDDGHTTTKVACKKCATTFALPPWPAVPAAAVARRPRCARDDDEVRTAAAIRRAAETPNTTAYTTSRKVRKEDDGRGRAGRRTTGTAPRDVAACADAREAAEAANNNNAYVEEEEEEEEEEGALGGWRVVVVAVRGSSRKRRTAEEEDEAASLIARRWRGFAARRRGPEAGKKRDRAERALGAVRRVQGAVRSRVLRRRFIAALEAARYVDAELDAIENADPIDLEGLLLDGGGTIGDAGDDDPAVVVIDDERWAARRAALAHCDDLQEKPSTRQKMRPAPPPPPAGDDGFQDGRSHASARSGTSTSIRSEVDSARSDLRPVSPSRDPHGFQGGQRAPRTADSDVSSLSYASVAGPSSSSGARLLPDIFANGPDQRGRKKRSAVASSSKDHLRRGSSLIPNNNKRPPRAPPPTSQVGRDRAQLNRRRTNIARPAWAKASDD